MTMKKKVIIAFSSAEFEKALNDIEGKFTQTHVTVVGDRVQYTGIIFYEE